MSTTRTRRTLRSIAVAAVLATGASLALASAPATAATAPASGKPFVVQVCGGRLVPHPATLVGSCLDGDLVWRDLRWSGADTRHPTAVGEQQQNASDTAKGPWTRTRVRLVLTRPSTEHGQRRFTQVVVEQARSHRVLDRYRLDGDGATLLD